MLTNTSLKYFLLAACAAFAIGACSDANVTSPGGGNQVDSGGGGDSGGGSGGGGGDTGTCPTGTTETTSVGNNTTCSVSGQLLSNLTLTSGVIYQLEGVVEVGADIGGDGNKVGGQSVTLTIQPGVRVFGQTGADALQINRGSQIIADGTSTLPIIFTSREDILGQATDTSRGQWGGIVVLGRGPISDCPGTPAVADCEALAEGVPQGFYGGAEVNDNSGILRYVQIKHSGFEVFQDNELNGILFAGVGAGTTVEYVQTHATSDDGFEWFGGTMNAKYLVATSISDDSLDWASGYVGNIQYALVEQNTDEGDRIIEADNLPSNHLRTPLTDPKIANFTFIGKQGVTNGQAILNRRGVAGHFVNGIVTDSPSCFDIDDTATETAGTQMDSVLLSCPVTFTADGNEAAAQAIFNAGSNNLEGNSSLVASYFPGPVEQSMTATDPSTLSGFFDSTDYVGAFSPTETSSNNWAFGWTTGLFAPATCPTGTTRVGVLNGLNRCEITGVVTDDLHLTAGNIYQLTGVVEIGADIGGDGAKAGGDPAVLTIDAGVTVFGNSGADALQINRGSQIVANGTRTSPVIFTALEDVNNTASATGRGLWGGIVVLGRAPISDCPGTPAVVTCEALAEGVPQGFYGGATSDDSSGSLRYVQIKHSGFEVFQDNELNGILFAGVGSGTTVEYVQTHLTSDDGFEWFGGTMNAKYLVATGISDDSFDWASGYVGNLQFLLAEQFDDEGDRIIEADNLPSNHLRTPLTNPTVANFTFIGKQGVTNGQAILNRRGVAGQFYNGVVAGSPSCFDVDDTATETAGTTFNSVLLDCPVAFTADGNEAAAQSIFEAGANNSSTVANTLTNTFVNGATENGRTAVDPTTINSFFTSTNYIGAVRDANDTWWQGGWACGLGSPAPAC